MSEDRCAAIAGVFDRAAATYDAVGVDFFQVFGAQLVANVDVAADDRVLDVGCSAETRDCWEVARHPSLRWS